jgi:hypothetical protein
MYIVKYKIGEFWEHDNVKDYPSYSKKEYKTEMSKTIGDFESGLESTILTDIMVNYSSVLVNGEYVSEEYFEKFRGKTIININESREMKESYKLAIIILEGDLILTTQEVYLLNEKGQTVERIN